jgi:hypothetical protein
MAMPWERVETPYQFEGPNSALSLAALVARLRISKARLASLSGLLVVISPLAGFATILLLTAALPLA